MANTTLFSFGPILFQVYPFNVSDVDHTTATDWSRKEIAGAAIHREWVGEGDEEIHLKGRLFPYFFGQHAQNRNRDAYVASGLNHLRLLDNMRRAGIAQLLIRGGSSGAAEKIGWFIIERLARGHTLLGPEGVGRQISFDATFQRVPVPSQLSAFSLWGGGSGGEG